MSVPKLEKLIKTWLKEPKEASIDDLLKLAEKLWDSRYHEEKSLAVFMLVHRAKNLTLAHLDEIAVNLVGNLIESDPERWTS